jgi:hypothetical protein
MIYFNQNDFNLPQIKEASKLRTALTKEDYRIYGLRQDDNPPILIEYCTCHDAVSDLTIKCAKIEKFFKRNGLQVMVDSFDREDDDEPIDFKVYIGLRKDIRADIALSSAILQTIIYSLDDRITLDDNYTIPPIRKFPAYQDDESTEEDEWIPFEDASENNR